LESKICPTCEQDKELTEYYSRPNKNGSICYWRVCKKCVGNRSIKWMKDNPEAYAKQKIEYAKTEKRIKFRFEEGVKQRKSGYSLAWIRAHPEKAKMYQEKHRQHDITEKEWRDCLKVFDNTCAYCGLPHKQHIIKRMGKYITMKFHKEHVDDKGYNDLRNAVPACQRCNSSKHQDSLDKWYLKQKFFSIDKYNFIVWWTTEGYKDYIDDKPPYRIVKKKNEDNNKFHHELWTVDVYRNMVEYVDRRKTKKEIEQDIKNGIIDILSFGN